MPQIKTCYCGRRCVPSQWFCPDCGKSLFDIDPVDVDEISVDTPLVDPPTTDASATPDHGHSLGSVACQHLYLNDNPACVYCNESRSDSSAVAVRWINENCVMPIGRLLVVGRGDSAPDTLTAMLIDDKYGNVSRRHASLQHEHGVVTIIDLGSANGTFVNDRRLDPHVPCDLHDGDIVRFAATLKGQIVFGRASGT